jgi:pyruvate dehydrogenase complex dehydrogenase (E1) component
MRDHTATNGVGADIDAIETREWLEALDAVITHDGPDRAQALLEMCSSELSSPARG